jgi:hypothetical protein
MAVDVSNAGERLLGDYGELPKIGGLFADAGER